MKLVKYSGQEGHGKYFSLCAFRYQLYSAIKGLVMFWTTSLETSAVQTLTHCSVFDWRHWRKWAANEDWQVTGSLRSVLIASHETKHICLGVFMRAKGASRLYIEWRLRRREIGLWELATMREYLRHRASGYASSLIGIRFLSQDVTRSRFHVNRRCGNGSLWWRSGQMM